MPADHKWFTRLCISEIVVAALNSLGLKYPKIGDEQLAELKKAKEELLKEKITAFHDSPMPKKRKLEKGFANVNIELSIEDDGIGSRPDHPRGIIIF